MKTFYLTSLLTLMTHLTLTAQSIPQELPAVVVTGSAPSPGSQIVPTLESARQKFNRLPGGGNVVDSKTIREGRTSNLRDTLDFQAGVSAQSRFGAEETKLSIRGSGLGRNFHGRGLLLLQDGVPINLADGGFDMQALEPLSTEYVEVMRGANATRYGASTLGGAIQFVSPTGYTADRLRLRAEAGSYGYLRGQISSGLVSGPYDYYTSLTQFYQDGFRIHSEQNTQRLVANAGTKISDTLENRLYVTAVKTDSRLPGNLTKAQLIANPQQAAAANVAQNHKRDFELLRLSDTASVRFDGGQFDASAFWSGKDLDHPVSQITDQNSHDMGADLRSIWNDLLNGRLHSLTAGVRPVFGWMRDERSTRSGGNTGPRIVSRDMESMNLEGYVESEFVLRDDFFLTSTLQASYATRRSSRDLPNRRVDEQTFSGLNPKLGFRWEYEPGAQAYGNVSRSFEPPSMGELGAFFVAPPAATAAEMNMLQAQTATTLELGTRGQHESIEWDASLYQAWIENELLTYNLGGGVSQTLNADQTIHRGVELAFTADLLSLIGISNTNENENHLALRPSYNWNHFTFDQDRQFGHNLIAGIPEHQVRAELLWRHNTGFYAGPHVEWVPDDFPIDNANSFFADNYALMGFRAGYHSPDGWSVFFDARNLTDETYASAIGTIANAGGRDSAQFLPGDGRSFYGGVEWKW